MHYLLRLISGAALLMFTVLFAAGIDFKILSGIICGNKRTLYAALLLLPVFLFIPMGALPSFVNLKGSAFLILLLILTSLLVYERRVTKIFIVMLAALVFLTLLLSFALNYGFPGTSYSLDMLSAVAVWNYLPWYGIVTAIGTVALFFAASGIQLKNQNLDFYTSLFITATCAAAVCFSIPFNVLMQHYAMSWKLYFAGFVCFWSAVYSIKKFILLIFADSKG